MSHPGSNPDDPLSEILFVRSLTEGLEVWGLTPPASFAEQCRRYYGLLVEWNRVFRLVGHTDAREIARNLFLDSLAASPHVPEGARVLDIGTGAGFPGLVLRLFRPDVRVVLTDSARKKIHFLQQVRLELGLTGVEPVHCRVGEETSPQLPAGGFDVVVSKALGSMDLMVRLGEPYLKETGTILGFKGPSALDEPLSFPGCRVRRVLYSLPGSSVERVLILVTRVPPD